MTRDWWFRRGISNPPRGCVLQRVYDDGQAYAICKGGKFARYSPRLGWSIHLRHS